MSQITYDQWKQNCLEEELKDINENISFYEGLYKQYWHKAELGCLIREGLEFLYKGREKYESELNTIDKTTSGIIRWFKTGFALAKDEAGSASFALCA